ncbi:MAG: hypothetical protein MK066_02240 [Crocinitomicaceae bacterium]|nr:hypothetical protein [Crocinitomicaceae bacterium]
MFKSRLEFTLSNQKEKYETLCDLTSDLKLHLLFRNKNLPTPLEAIHISNCNEKATVEIFEGYMLVSVKGTLSPNQIEYLLKHKNMTAIKFVDLQKEWSYRTKNNPYDPRWRELIFINQIIVKNFSIGGSFRLEQNTDHSKLTFKIPFKTNDDL